MSSMPLILWHGSKNLKKKVNEQQMINDEKVA